MSPAETQAEGPEAAGDETSRMHYCRGSGWELVPGSPVLLLEGGDSALPQPREPPELRQRTGGARSSSCPRPGAGET